MMVEKAVRKLTLETLVPLSWNDLFCHQTLIKHLLCASYDNKQPIIIIINNNNLNSPPAFQTLCLPFFLPDLKDLSKFSCEGGCIMNTLFRCKKGRLREVKLLSQITQSGQSWGSAPGLLTPPLQRLSLLPQTPPPLEPPAPAMDPPELRFGGQCSGKGGHEPRGHWAWRSSSHTGVASLPSMLTMLLSPSRVQESGHHGAPGATAPAPAGRGSLCEAGAASGEQ